MLRCMLKMGKCIISQFNIDIFCFFSLAIRPNACMVVNSHFLQTGGENLANALLTCLLVFFYDVTRRRDGLKERWGGGGLKDRNTNLLNSSLSTSKLLLCLFSPLYSLSNHYSLKMTFYGVKNLAFRRFFIAVEYEIK